MGTRTRRAATPLSLWWLSLSSILFRRLHQNASCRDGEGATEAVALKGFAIRTVVRVIAGTGVVIPGLVDLCGLTDFYASSRDAAVERFEGQTDIGEQEGLFAGALPRPVSRGRYRARGEGQLIGFRVPSARRSRSQPLGRWQSRGWSRCRATILPALAATADTRDPTAPAVRRHVEQRLSWAFREQRKQPKQSWLQPKNTSRADEISSSSNLYAS
jgi:hypothetical protein